MPARIQADQNFRVKLCFPALFEFRFRLSRKTKMSKEEQDEERKLFVSNLPATLEVLCSMHASPHDDTILHHLLDNIKLLITSEDDARRSGLFEFVATVKGKVHSLPSPVLVLGLGVATHLACITGQRGEAWQRVTSFYDVVQSTVASGCSSVGAAYFSSLTKVAAWPAGLRWLEDGTVHFQTALSTLETAQSIFLLNAAENFVLAALTNSLEADGPDLTRSGPPSPVAVEGVKLLTSKLTEMTRSRATLLDQMLSPSHTSPFHQSLVKIVCALTRLKAFCEWKVVDSSLVATLSHLALQHSSESIQSSALKSVINLAEYMSKSAKEPFLKEIVASLLKMVYEGGVERSISVAAAFVKASQKTEDLESLKQLVQLPHDLLFAQKTLSVELTSLVSAITTSLCTPQSFGKLTSTLLQSVKQTRNREGLVRLVVSVSLTRDDENWVSTLSSWPQGVGAVVVGNHKLLHALLDVLQQDDCLDFTLSQCTEVLMTLMRIMRRPLVESRLYSQTCAAFLGVLRRHYGCLDPADRTSMEGILVHWVGLMEYRLVAVHWEIRDTTLELVRDVVGIVSEPWFLRALTSDHLLRLAWNCSRYGESYPRASAISLATSLIRSPLWELFLQDAGITEATLADEMMEILANDTEAFPRRAAVLLLTALVSPCTPPSPPSSSSDGTVQRNKICTAMTTAMNDFDWDVKLKVLDFWEKLASPLFPCGGNVESGSGGEMNIKSPGMMSDNKVHRKRTAPNHGHASDTEYRGMLETLLKDGYGEALLLGADDYDSAVKQKALRMLVSVQKQLEVEEGSPVKAQRLHEEESDTPSSQSVEVGGEETSNGQSASSSGRTVVSVGHFWRAVSQLDPVRLLQQQSRSADEYDRKPSSLLEDVMAAVRLAAAASEVTLMSEDEFDDADDMFVDCY